ncbi:hypothetical protein H072_6653 [Dactylellina haptotyla CBS 200.50]|uniref:NADP-dependent oxidoreductase domain-containing protein n=1 Tax=Dactylellina haptotyla (strain CBS 200.50) TaxID=1284197 RepID=S8BJI8_DACHA|nr:hypothetical protein H072_6653 [Dactylellina haptotyla CBS 200.50]
MPSQMNIVLGAMGFGQEGTETARVFSIDDVGKIIDRFTARGYKEIDTARIYGNGTSEEYLAAINWQARGLIMETKLFPTANMPIPIPDHLKYNHHKGNVRRGLLDSLKALGADKIDMFYLHAPDRTVEYEETLQEVNELYQEGYFKRFGISNYAAWEVARICDICDKNGWVKPSVYQGVYNCFGRSVEQELIPCLRKYGLSIYIFNPLAGGLLTGKHSRETTNSEIEAGSRFDEKKFLGKAARVRYWNDKFFDALDLVRPVAEKNGLTSAECALRWLVHHSALKKDLGDAIILGASSINHLESNLDDVEKGPLPEDVVKAIDAGWGAIQGVASKYFHG